MRASIVLATSPGRGQEAGRIGAYDYFKVLDKIPADKAFRPLAEEKGTCGLVKTTMQTGSAK